MSGDHADEIAAEKRRVRDQYDLENMTEKERDEELKKFHKTLKILERKARP